MGSMWLVGSNGLYCGSPLEGWQAIGAYSFPVNGIAQLGKQKILAAETGFWCVPEGNGRWIQWHDETLTSVLGVVPVPVGVGVVTASAYGIATGELDNIGSPRWTWHSDGLSVNARYSNVVLVDPNNAVRWIVGTETGVLVREHGEGRWVHTSLVGHPVRALCYAAGVFWAGADGGGVWRSEDGVSWLQAGTGLKGTTVFSLAWTGDRLIAGLDGGIAVGTGEGRWIKTGPNIRVRTIGADGDLWLAGANPGGLWFSETRGKVWRKTGDFISVRTLSRQEVG